jgi:hypothetical protein
MSEEHVRRLEEQARQQRNALHHTASEIQRKIGALREQLSPKENIKHHFGLAASLVALLGVAAGYGIAGVFTDDRS